MNKFSQEISALVRLALPVSLAQLSLVGMSATDVLIAGNASTVDLAGMNLGANTWNMIALFFMGVGFATQPLVANHFGAGSPDKIKRQMQQSIWLCLLMGLACTVFVYLAAWGLAQVSFDPDMRDIAVDYLRVMGLCSIPFCLLPALRGTLEGMSFTGMVFVINFSAFLLNIPLDYVLVHGLYGFDRLGGVGCAWATVVLVWLSALFLALALWLHKRIRARQLFANFERPDRWIIQRTWRLGYPIGLAIVIELSMFCGAGMLIALFGTVQASAHAVAITIGATSFMLYNGLAQGVTIRASQFLGALRPARAEYTVKVGVAFNLAVACVICVLYVLFNEQLVHLFSSDQAVIKLAVVLLYFGAAFQIVDCLQVAVVYALRAYHDTKTPPKVMFIGFFLFGLPLGIYLAFFAGIPALSGAKGLWLAMVASLSLVGALLLAQLKRTITHFDKQEYLAEELRA